MHDACHVAGLNPPLAPSSISLSFPVALRSNGAENKRTITMFDETNEADFLRSIDVLLWDGAWDEAPMAGPQGVDGSHP